jgi:hypothetical protein
MKPWSLSRRRRMLALARYFDGLAMSIRAKVKAHTPKRPTKPHLVKAA